MAPICCPENKKPSSPDDKDAEGPHKKKSRSLNRGWLLTGIGDLLAERLQAGIRLAVEDGARVPPFEIFLFTRDSKQHLVDRLNSWLSAQRVAFPSHRVLLGELRGFEYLGSAGASGRTRTGHGDRGMMW